MYLLHAFKNLTESELDLSTPLTVLIGRNGAGKSNVVEALELLARLASGISLGEITDAGRGLLSVRGGLHGCINSELSSIKLGLRSGPTEFTIELAANESVYIRQERFLQENVEVYNAKVTDDTSVISVRYNNFARGPNKPSMPRPSDRATLASYGVLPIQTRTTKQIGARLRAHFEIERVRTLLQSVYAFDPVPRLMRGYERIGDDVLAPDGRNLSAVLLRLSETESEASQRAIARILELVRQLPEEPFSRFEFVKTQLNDVMFGLVPEPEVGLVDARLLSDGTLRCLAILSALSTVPEGSIVVVEELDNGLHPSRVRLLIQTVYDLAVERKLKVLCTTQNPATLNALNREQLAGVIVCHRNAGSRSARLTRLLRLPGSDILLEQGPLGDIVTRELLEAHLMPDFEDERGKRVKKWLESLP